ncbi:MAG: hypothetical protein HY049_05665 [Acidobacteria bacterium]|nr:hypothetical protein [Acidobacteriota bacterium]
MWRKGLALAVVLSVAGGTPSAAPTAPAKQPPHATYDVTLKSGPIHAGAQRTYVAENPENNLRLEFRAAGVVAVPRIAQGEAWSLDLQVLNVVRQGHESPVGSPRISATANIVSYDFETASVRYVNGPGGLEQVLTIPSPSAADEAAAPATVSFDLALGEDLTSEPAAYFVDLVAADGQRVLRYGAIRAVDANGRSLLGEISTVPDDAGPARVRILVHVADAIFPVEVHATLRRPGGLDEAAPAGSEEIEGLPQPLAPLVEETVVSLSERERLAPASVLAIPVETHPEYELELQKKENPLAPEVASWPPAAMSVAAPAGPPSLPQTLGPVSFKGISLSESGFIPPDSMGDVGPTQILMHENGRIKVFDRLGVLGALNVTDATFWASVRGSSQPSDPEVRYDRLTGRWFVVAINTAASNNRVMIAWTAPNATITGTASFTFTFYTGPVAADGTNCFLDYETLGVDINALYIGGNLFCGTPTQTFAHSSVGVIPKAPMLAGSGTVFQFANVTSGVTAGPYTALGVDNDDPLATEGYFIGVDVAAFSIIQVRRVSSPGGTPTLSGNLSLTVPTETSPILQPASGSTTSLDTSDDRLFKAKIRKNKLTGASTLWTAHNIQVNASCVGSNTGGRNGARWYEITGSAPTAGAPLGGSIALAQSGTLCDPAATNPRGFIYPSVAETGQGHMALGATFAASNLFAGVAVAGRLRTDATGATEAPTTAQSGGGSYSNVSQGRNRWGDYSHTAVDPTDDQTVWTFQEYADATNSWSVRAVELLAPAPATPASVPAVCTGLASTCVTLTGTSVSGSEFFDPQPPALVNETPAYASHISATVTGGVTVLPWPATNIIVPGAPATTPVTQMNICMDTTAATAGARDVTVRNPDGQQATGSGILTVVATPSAPTAGNGGPICEGALLQLSTTTVAGATYSWTGPNGFSSSVQNPSIPGATSAASGTYTVTVTVNGCTSTAAMTTAAVTGAGGSCGNPSSTSCDAPDTCGAGGVCQSNLAASGTSCAGTSNGGGCDGTDACDGAGTCVDGFLAATTVCRPSAGPCDVAESCTGNSGVCPADVTLAPGEVDAGVDITMSGGIATITWNLAPGSSSSDVVRGGAKALPVGPAGADETCLADDIAGASIADSATPPLGDAFWYLVRGSNACGPGSWGNEIRSGQSPIPRVTTTCP